MEKEHKIKHVVKVLSITKQFQKIHFTLRHPENALYLSGIAVTGTKVYEAGLEGITRPDSAGFLSLAIPEKGDVFYTEQVKSEKSKFLDFAEQRLALGFLKNAFGFSGKRKTYFDTCVPITEALMEGYYEDTSFVPVIIFLAFSPPPPPSITPYTITLYLRYVMNEDQQS